MNPLKTIYLKEMRDMFRDKRVRNSAFFGPLMMVAMMMFAFGFLIDAVSKPQNQKVHVVKADNAFVKSLRTAGVQVIAIQSLEAGRKMVRDGDARVVLQFEPDYDKKLESNSPTTIKMLFNRSEQVSMLARSGMQEMLTKLNGISRNQLLALNKIPLEKAEPLKFDEEDVKVGASKTNELLTGFLPYLIVIWAFYGGMSIVTDLVAGEKEKNTLETLLITPVKRSEIALGKFLSLGTVCLLSSLSALAGVYLVAMLKLPVTQKMFENGVGVTPQAAAVIILVIAPSVALFSSVMIAVSAYARNVRESQSYLTLISFIVLMPAIASQFIGYTDAGSSRWVNYVPVLNAANTIRQAMFGKFDAGAIGTTVGVSLVLALIAMRVVVVTFNREEVLTRV